MTFFLKRLSILAFALSFTFGPGIAAAKTSADDFKKLAGLDFALVERLADGGEANAQLELATRYAAGKDVAKDERKAFEIIKVLADKNDHAMYLMGAAYANGIGVEKDDVRAVEWFRRSAAKGNANGQYWLAEMIITGRAGGPSDPKAAKPWLEKAARQGDAGSQYALAIMIGNGQAGDRPSWTRAVPHLKKAADQDISSAAMVLGILYASGKGVKKNNDEAAKWYRRSIAIDRNAQSQVNLDQMIDAGLVKLQPGDPQLDLSAESLGLSAEVTGKN